MRLDVYVQNLDVKLVVPYVYRLFLDSLKNLRKFLFKLAYRVSPPLKTHLRRGYSLIHFGREIQLTYLILRDSNLLQTSNRQESAAIGRGVHENHSGGMSGSRKMILDENKWIQSENI